jgi:DNA-binding transcriptional LysR family regulator
MVNQMRSVVEFVKQGLGIAMVPAYLVKEGDQLFQHRVEKFSESYICMAIRKYERLPQVISELMVGVRKHSDHWKKIQ